MAEQINLTTPVAITNYRIASLTLNWADAVIYIVVVDDHGTQKLFQYTGQLATDTMIALNKANLSIKSLHRRAMEFIVAQGGFAGSISGTPD